MLSVAMTGLLTVLFRRRLQRWPPIVRIASTVIALTSIGSDILFCFLSSHSAQFYGGLPQPGGWVILGSSAFVCSCALAARLYKTKLALDGAAALASSMVYAPFLLLVALDGDLLVWLPWRDTEATNSFDGFPDIESMKYPYWALVTRKLPLLVYMSRTAVSTVQIASVTMSALSLALSFAQRLLQTVALSSKDVDVVVGRARDFSPDRTTDQHDGRLSEEGWRQTNEPNGTKTCGGILVRNRQTAVLLTFGLALSVLTWTNNIPAVARLISIMVVVLYVLGGMAAFLAVAAAVYVFYYYYFLRCRKRKVVHESILEMLEMKAELSDKQTVELVGTAEELRTQRHLAERLQVQKEYTDRMLEAQGIKIDAFLPLDDVKQNYAAAFEQYRASNSDLFLAEVERWDRVLGAHPDLIAERKKEEEAWRQLQLPHCAEALAVMRTFVPLNIRELAKSSLEQMGLSPVLARRVANPTLSLLVTHPADIERMHLADLSSKVRRITYTNRLGTELTFLATLGTGWI